MQWPIGFFLCVVASCLASAAGYLAIQYLWRRRIGAMRQEMARLSEDVLQLADLQMDLYRRVCRDLTSIEGRVLDLSAPSSDAPPPLERRHQVLTLARKGMALDEISRRLNIPRGEAELIMNLRKYMEQLPADGMRVAIKRYAQATS